MDLIALGIPNKKICFLDRDGVINEEVNYLHKIEDFRFTDKCLEALGKIQAIGYELVIVTNQAGIGRGIFDLETYNKLTEHYVELARKQNIEFLDILHCPHHPQFGVGSYKLDCPCRKPNPGMLLKVLGNHAVDIDASIMVGDKVSDLLAGKRAGLTKTYLVTSGHRVSDIEKQAWPTFDGLYQLACFLEANDRS